VSDAVERRLQRAAEGIAACRADRTTGPQSVAAFLELEDGRHERSILEQLDAEQWPAWPPEADGYHHAWVREHWTPEAAEEWDFLTISVSSLNSRAAEVLADEVYAGESLADAFAAAGLDPPPDGFSGTARDHLARIRGPHVVETFDSHLAKMHDFGAKWPTQPPAFREQNRRWLAEAERKYTNPTDDERARILEGRGIGIRGEGYDWRLYSVHYQDLAEAAGVPERLASR